MPNETMEQLQINSFHSGVVRFRDHLDLGENKTRVLNMLPDGSTYMTGFLDKDENREWLGDKFFGENGLLDEDSQVSLYNSNSKVSDLFQFDNATPEELWGNKYKNVSDPGKKEILYMGEIYKKTASMDSDVRISPVTLEGIQKDESVLCVQSKETMNSMSAMSDEYKAARKCNSLEFGGALDDFSRKAEKENKQLPFQIAGEAKVKNDRLVESGKKLLSALKDGSADINSDETLKALEEYRKASEEYINTYGIANSEALEAAKRMDRTVQNTIEKEKEYQNKLNNDLLVNENGKMFKDATLEERESFCDNLEEKGLIDEHDYTAAEKEYASSELKQMNANELVGKAAGKGNNKNAANAGNYILGRFDDNVNHGVEPDAYDVARVKNFDANVDYLSQNKSFQKMVNEKGLQYTKETWPEVEKESDAIREQFRKENAEFEEARKSKEKDKPAEEKDYSDKVADAFDKLDNGTKEEKNKAINEVARESIDIAADTKENYEELQYNLNNGDLGAAMENAGNLYEQGKKVLKAAIKNSGSAMKNYEEYNRDPNGFSKKFEDVELDEETKQKMQDRLGIDPGDGKISGQGEDSDPATEMEKAKKSKEDNPTEREYIEGKDPKDLDGKYNRYSERTVDRLIADDPDFGRKLADAMAVEKVEKKSPRIEKEVKKEKEAGKDKEAEKEKEKESKKETDKKKLTEEQHKALGKNLARERLAVYKLKDKPKGYEKNGKPDSEKVQCVTQLVASNYIKQHPEEFKNSEEMDQFTQKCLSNKEFKAALLRISEEKSGEEILELVKDKKIGATLKEAMEKNAQNPEDSKTKQYYKDAAKIKVPRVQKDPKTKTDPKEIKKAEEEKKEKEKAKEKEKEKDKDKEKNDPEKEKDKPEEKTKEQKEEEKKNDAKDTEIYEKVRKDGAKVFKENKVLEGKKKDAAYSQLENGRMGNNFVDKLTEKYKEKFAGKEDERIKKQRQRILGEKDTDKDKDKEKDKQKDKTKSAKANKEEAARKNLSEEQLEGLKKHEAKGRVATDKLKKEPSGYKKDGKVNSEKIKSMTQAVATNYIKKHPDKFKGVGDMNNFVKDFYANQTVKAAMLSIADKYSGEEIAKLIESKKFSSVLEEEIQNMKKTPKTPEERKQKRGYMQAAEKLRTPVFEEDIEAQNKLNMQNFQQKSMPGLAM